MADRARQRPVGDYAGIAVNLYQYRAKIERVVDGDTVIAFLSLGLHAYKIESLRLAGVNAPEIFRGDNVVAGIAAKDFVRAWVEDAGVDRGTNDIYWPFEVETFRDRQTFGRYIGNIVRRDTGESLADALVEAGHAVRSTG